MNREYHHWHSSALNREMQLLVFGHAGARVLVFPTSQGSFYDWEDRSMMETLGEHLENGWLQLYCVDSVDAESWYCSWAQPSGRAQRQAEYDSYLYSEVLPFSEQNNPNPFLITAGASFGGYHAMNFGLKHPEKVSRILAMSGLFDVGRFAHGYSDDNVYYNNPIQFIAHENDSHRLELLRHLDIIMATGREDSLISSAREMSRVLWDKGIGNALREWDGWSHDWPYWQQMLLLYIGGHD